MRMSAIKTALFLVYPQRFVDFFNFFPLSPHISILSVNNMKKKQLQRYLIIISTIYFNINAKNLTFKTFNSWRVPLIFPLIY